MNINKTNQNARSYSDKAKRIEQNNEGKQLVLGGSLFGGKSINDVVDGYESSVQSSIDDLYAISVYNIGDVRTTLERIDPGGLPQIDEWKLDDNGFVYSETQFINILGKRVEMKEGYSSGNVILETKKVIEDYIEDGLYFSEVEQIDNLTLRVTYIDRRSHIGLNINPDSPWHHFNIEIIRNVVYGYGQWIYMGVENRNIGETSYTLHYYQRVG